VPSEGGGDYSSRGWLLRDVYTTDVHASFDYCGVISAGWFQRGNYDGQTVDLANTMVLFLQGEYCWVITVGWLLQCKWTRWPSTLVYECSVLNNYIVKRLGDYVTPAVACSDEEYFIIQFVTTTNISVDGLNDGEHFSTQFVTSANISVDSI